MLVVTFLNLTASSVPAALQVTAVKVLVPAGMTAFQIIKGSRKYTIFF
jgi:hypothetical protein